MMKKFLYVGAAILFSILFFTILQFNLTYSLSQDSEVCICSLDSNGNKNGFILSRYAISYAQALAKVQQAKNQGINLGQENVNYAFFEVQSSFTNCEEFCAPSLNKKIDGHVFWNNGTTNLPLRAVSVKMYRITSSSGNEEPQAQPTLVASDETDEGGYFDLGLISFDPNLNYFIVVEDPNNVCGQKNIDVYTNQEFLVNFPLEIIFDENECSECNYYVYGEWSSCNFFGFRTRSYEINESCPIVSGDLHYIEPCSSFDIPSTCGNGQLDEGEDCDFVNDEIKYRTGVNCNVCNVQTCSCFSVNPPACGNGVCELGEEETCLNDCYLGENTCSNAIITINDVSDIYLEKALSVDYDASSLSGCGETIFSLYLERWNNCNLTQIIEAEELNETIISSACSNSPSQLQLNTNVLNSVYQDYGVNANKTYCYRLAAVFTNFVVESNFACENVGVEECVSGAAPSINSKICYNSSSLTYCQNNVDNNDQGGIDTITNTLTFENCGEGNVCVAGKCVEYNDCEACNSIFGNFFNMYDTILVPSSGQTNPRCSDLITSSPEEAGENNKICFIDSKLSSYYINDCSQITSCYDYNSYLTCISNPCNVSYYPKYSEESGCEWNPLFGLEFVGVCKPKASDLEDCSVCNDLENCNEVICQEGFGDSCYYDFNSKLPPSYNLYPNGRGPYYCVSENNISCEFYDDEQDCEGATSFEIDPKTNMPVSLSSDYFGFGKCVWNSRQGYCFKDSDSDGNFDCSDWEGDLLECLRDFEPPTTELQVPGERYFVFICPSKKEGQQSSGGGEIPPLPCKPTLRLSQEILVTGKDNLRNIVTLATDSGTGVYQTKYYVAPANVLDDGSLSKIDFDSLPNTDDYFTDLSQLVSSELISGTGPYYLLYYSQDNSKNLEEVKYMPIFIVTEEPILDINYQVNQTTYESVGREDVDIYSLDINFSLRQPHYNFNLTSPSRNFRNAVTCSYNVSYTSLFSQGTLQAGYFTHTFNDLEDNHVYTLNLKLGNLPSGNYFLRFNCTDSFGQESVKEVSFELDTTPSIFNQSPALDALKDKDSPIPIEVYTSSEGECRYSLNPSTISFNDMDNVFSSQPEGENYKHTSIVTPANLSTYQGPLTEGKIFIIPVACNLTLQDGSWRIFQGNPNDFIYFAYDFSPPVATITNYDPITATQHQMTEVNLTFDCFDLPTNNTFEGVPYSINFGCNKIYYTLLRGNWTREEIADQIENLNWNFIYYTESIPLNFTHFNHTLVYQAEDKGRNRQEDFNYTLILLYPPEPPKPINTGNGENNNG